MNISSKVKSIFEAESKAINSIPITPSYDEVIDIITSCSGNIITIGIGKAGHVSKKFAATLCSIGRPAVYLHPGEAAHGDLGVIGEGDVLIAFSTSGKTREVIETVKLGKPLGLSKIISITSHPESELRDISDVVVDMGIIEEPCPIGLTPSASMAVMLAISDAIALTYMEVVGVSKEDFGARHHGGYLGEKSRIPD